MRKFLLYTGLTVMSFSIVVFAFGAVRPVKSVSGQLDLSISIASTVVAVGERVPVRITVSNQGSHPVTLVHPGDGSESGWRTPVIGWSLTRIDAQANPDVSDLEVGRCGNINALSADEVFQLGPGESQGLSEWASLYAPPVAGEYSIRLSYENRPQMEWKGIPLGEHDWAAMVRVRNSTPCSLTSNELRIKVTG